MPWDLICKRQADTPLDPLIFQRGHVVSAHPDCSRYARIAADVVFSVVRVLEADSLDDVRPYLEVVMDETDPSVPVSIRRLAINLDELEDRETGPPQQRVGARMERKPGGPPPYGWAWGRIGGRPPQAQGFPRHYELTVFELIEVTIELDF